MPTADCLPDTWADLFLIHSSLIPSSCTNQNNRRNIARPRTASKQTAPLNGPILLLFYLDELTTLIWLGVVPHIAIDIFLGSTFIGCFIRRIFSSQCNVVHQLPRPVAIIVHSKSSQNTHIARTYYKFRTKEKSKHTKQTHFQRWSRVARQIKLQLNKQHHALVTTKITQSTYCLTNLDAQKLSSYASSLKNDV